VNPELRNQLETLHSELNQTQSVDDDSRALLVALLIDISRLLDTSQASWDEDHSLVERLDVIAVQFEAEHPALGAAIRRIIDTLAKAGI